MTMDPLTLFKSVYSTILLIFSVITILALISYEQTNLSASINSAAAYILFITSITWLTMLEAGQASLVGLHPVSSELYKDSHPIAYKSTSITTKGDNLDRYLLGRQFMVVMVIFCVNLSGAPFGGDEFWALPDWLKSTFFNANAAMILVTCMIGQLSSQVNASLCMLDYINNSFALFTVWVVMAIEFSGLLHAAYFIQILVGKCSGKKIESNEPPRCGAVAAFFWFRIILSLIILTFCIVVTIVALFTGRTTIWDRLPPSFALIIFLVLMCVVGMLEGMQIAFFAVANLPASERGSSVFAIKTCTLLFPNEGNNKLPHFMIGRQLCVVSCMFFVARVTSIRIAHDQDNIFGAPEFLQEFYNTGLLGALLLTILGSISWQLVASVFPIAFLSNPATYILLRWCLFLESTGICQGAWVLAAIHQKIAAFQRDDVYIGTAEERAKQDVSSRSGECIVVTKNGESMRSLFKGKRDSVKCLRESLLINDNQTLFA